MTALIPLLGRKRSGCRHGKLSEASTFLERYRSNLAAITAERQPEIDALSRKLARQDAAIKTLRARYMPELQPPHVELEPGRRTDGCGSFGDCRPGEWHGAAAERDRSRPCDLL
jgi:hypothetical protein